MIPNIVCVCVTVFINVLHGALYTLGYVCHAWPSAPLLGHSENEAKMLFSSLL